MSDETKNLQSVLLDHVCSMEYYKVGEDEEPKQVLTDICLEINKGEIWSLIGGSAFELRLLLEIIANARPYQNGKCVLDQRGMMRKKRVILPHVYYIGSTNMLFDNMNVLEYLMFITAKQKGDVVERQKAILQNLLDHEMGYIALSAIHDLSPDERVVVTLMAAMYTESTIIVLNLARLTYSEKSLIALKRICETIKEQERTLIFSAFDYQMVEQLSTHIAVLKDGHLIFKGITQAFINTWDHLSIVIEDERTEELTNILQEAFANIDLHVKENRVEIWDPAHDLILYDKVFNILNDKKLYPYKIYQHTNCVENAWEEIKLHDL